METKRRRVFLNTMSCGLLLLMLTGTASAKEWDLRRGDILIQETEGRPQTVTQGEKTVEDPSPVITSQKAEADFTITIETDEKSEARLMLRDLNLKKEKGPGILVGSSSAWIQVREDSLIGTADPSAAAVQVEDGEVLLSMRKGSSLTLEAVGGSALGSPEGKDLAGRITVGGSGQLKAGSVSGAGIGSGAGGSVSGEISLGTGANVSLSSQSGQMLGSGSGKLRVETGVTLSGNPVEEASLQAYEENLETVLEIPGTLLREAYEKPGRRESAPIHKTIGRLCWVNVGTKKIQGDADLREGVLTIRVAEEEAELSSSAFNLNRLHKHGIYTLRFITQGKTSDVDVGKTAEGRKKSELMKLHHKGETAVFTVNGEDLTDQLK